MASVTRPPKPTIFLLSLSDHEVFDEVFSELVNTLCSKATLQRATKPGPALSYLHTKRPFAILITDPGILEPAHAAVVERVVDYVRGGGTAVIGGVFASFAHFDKVKPFFASQWGLPWDLVAYTSADASVNRGNVGVREERLRVDGLLQNFYQKAVLLGNVETDAALYVKNVYPDEDSDEDDEELPEKSTVQHRVSPIQNVDFTEAPVIFTKFGEGWLGFMGVVNSDNRNTKIVMAMLGL